jgi:hypothetical protein
MVMVTRLLSLGLSRKVAADFDEGKAFVKADKSLFCKSQRHRVGLGKRRTHRLIFLLSEKWKFGKVGIGLASAAEKSFNRLTAGRRHP